MLLLVSIVDLAACKGLCKPSLRQGGCHWPIFKGVVCTQTKFWLFILGNGNSIKRKKLSELCVFYVWHREKKNILRVSIQLYKHKCKFWRLTSDNGENNSSRPQFLHRFQLSFPKFHECFLYLRKKHIQNISYFFENSCTVYHTLNCEIRLL